MNTKFWTIKKLGFLVALAGIATTMASDWVREKEMEELIDEKINERLNATEDEEES